MAATAVLIELTAHEIATHRPGRRPSPLPDLCASCSGNLPWACTAF